jgi:signal transduction histidine kinase
MLKPWDANDMKSAVREALGRRATAEATKRVVEARRRRNAELRTALEELAHTQRQVLAAERLSTLGRLTAGITHDIRNQANVMLLLVESVKLETEDATVHEAAEQALASLRSLTSLVQDVNAFASDSGWALHRTPVDPRRFAEETVGFLALEPGGRGREVRVDVDPELVELAISPLSMRQGLLSLLRNASQASPPATPIGLRVARAADGETFIEVEDRGRGMDEEEMQQALQPFYSAFEPPGLGLGLEIARLVVEAHGGRLELSSRRGEGTTGRLVIPTNPSFAPLEGDGC